MGAVAAGLIFSTGVKLLPALRSNVLGPTPAYVFAALMFACIALLRVPLAWMLGGLGIARRSCSPGGGSSHDARRRRAARPAATGAACSRSS